MEHIGLTLSNSEWKHLLDDSEWENSPYTSEKSLDFGSATRLFQWNFLPRKFESAESRPMENEEQSDAHERARLAFVIRPSMDIKIARHAERNG